MIKMDKDDTLADIIRKEVMRKVIENGKDKDGKKHICGSLYYSFLNVMEIKEILYETLMNIEINDIKRKWGKE